MGVTIADVAKLAGVGTTTVSRVINNDRTVREETRQRVIAAMQELNYCPNPAARSLGRGGAFELPQSRCIGLVFGEYVTRTHAYYSDILEEVEAELARKQYHVIFSTFNGGQLGTEGNALQMINSRMISAVIIVGQVPRTFLEATMKEGFPVVMVDASTDIDEIDYVVCDNVRGARMAVSHLAELGHDRIALIKGPGEHGFSREIYKGYREELEERGLVLREELIKEGDYHPESGYAAMSQLLQLPELPTAVLTNDEMALGAIRAINEKGLSVPHDISVAGFDGIELLAHIQPSLTTVRVPRKEMGRLAAKKLIEIIEEGEEEHCFSISVLPVRLVIGESTGAARPHR